MLWFNRHWILFVLFCAFLLHHALCNGIGSCPKLPYMQNFNLTRFTGKWNEIERSFYLMQVISNCVSLDLKKNRKGNLEVAVSSQIRWTDNISVKVGVAMQTRRDPSVLQYKMVKGFSKIFSKINTVLPGAGLYQILDTDYENYAILWSCSDYGLFYTDLIWIWGRKREFDASLRSYIYSFLSRTQLDSERLILPKSTNCTD